MPFQDGTVVRTPSEYAGLLTDSGCTVDAWETTYIHELSGDTPVLDWITGSSLTAVKSRLSEEAWQHYRAELAPILAQAYPARADGRTFYPFRRIFVVATKD
jgi:trans-aconitate 2-methyltransferase